MSASPLSVESIVIRNPEFVTAEMDEDLVMMSLESNNYYSLDSIGRAIWELLEEPLQVSALCERLLEDFDVERSRCVEDVVEFLTELEASGLIRCVR